MSHLTFRYTAIDPNGVLAKGAIEATNREEAFRQILADGLKPLRIVSKRTKQHTRKVTLRDLSQFTYQLSVLMEAKIPLVTGLQSIAEHEQKASLRQVIEEVARQIEEGRSVTDAFGPHRRLFGDVYIESVSAAENSGSMTEVLAMLASMLDRKYEMTKNIKGALMYPTCILSTLAIAVVFLMQFVIPRFAEMFARRGLELPLLTRIVIGISRGIQDYWYLIAAVAVFLAWSGRRALRKQDVRVRVDSWLHKVPYLRNILTGLAVSRFANIMGIALSSGLGLINALEMAGRASGRPLLQEDVESMTDKLNAGSRLPDVIDMSQYLPPFTRRMIATGDNASNVPKMCVLIAKNYDREVSHLVKNVSTVIEPIVIVLMAVVILLFAIAIFLPMWSMASLIG